MAERETPVQTVVIDYHCDEEGCDGKVVRDESKPGMWTSDPPQLPHVCSECGREYSFPNASYPKIGYKKIVDNE